MKVQDLIAKLSELPADTEIFVNDGVGDTWGTFDLEEWLYVEGKATLFDPFNRGDKKKGVRLTP